MEDAIRQRINKILSYYDITINRFSNGDSALQNRLSRQLSRGSAITSDTICLIMSKFSEISSEWLLRGEGDMIKPQHEQTVEPQPALISAEGNTPEASVLYQIYNDAIKKTQELVEENTKLKAQVTELSEGSEELAKVLRSYHDSNQELADENQQLKVEIMIKESQLKERDKVILDYKELLKEAI